VEGDGSVEGWQVGGKMKRLWIALTMSLGCLLLGCTGSGTPVLTQQTARDEVVFDGGGFLYRSGLSGGDDPLRLYTDDVVLGKPDRHTVELGTNPFSPNPIRVFVFEPDSVSVQLLSVEGDTVGDYGAHYLDRGLYALHFDDTAANPGTYFVRIGYKGRTQTRKWIQLK
jgi:hypothetical protein